MKLKILMEEMNLYKISGMKDPFEELSLKFLISPGLNYLGINL